jgi:hypothetical protein
MASTRNDFDPRAILAALERKYVDFILIGAIARVLRGSHETSRGLDICPAFGAENITRLGQAVGELGGRRVDRRKLVLEEGSLGAEDVVDLVTTAGELKLVGAPAGAPNGFVDLRRAATREHLGHGLRPLVASTGDLARMAAALHREQDVKRLPELRRIMELEADRELTLAPPTVTPSRGLQSGRRAAIRGRRAER